MTRRNFVGALSALAASIPFIGAARWGGAALQRPVARTMTLPWDENVLRNNPDWIIAGEPRSYTVKVVQLDGVDITNECFAVNVRTMQAGCYLPTPDPGWADASTKDLTLTQVKVLRQGRSVLVVRKKKPDETVDAKAVIADIDRANRKLIAAFDNALTN